jgi:hypothetical protein
MFTLVVSLEGLTSCTTSPPRNEPQAFSIPTARGDWRIQCGSGLIIPHFIGSYAQAINVPECAGQGGVVKTWDNGLEVYGLSPSWLTTTYNFVEEAADDPAARVRRTTRPELAGAYCAAAVCTDSAGTQYRVTYLDRRPAGRDRFSCPDAGLLNNPRGAADVPACAVAATPQACPIGVLQMRRAQ